MERTHFYLTEFSDSIVDIREQYPVLPLEEALVMTPDFLLTIEKGKNSVELARTIKMKEELLKERDLEKFEVDRVYWKKEAWIGAL
ncbi:TnsA endonuclease N-terminal domain-containing protein [Staphylococcus pseudintermedius]|uniref:TnsA endonuclease N-terminal domain-containing protein n=2 Tax=Staphylococcus pseudintermedius TaxID=283734 RepID=UPI001EE44A39|nr:TnsA endonuclease N-terminal domain-containing protein [Staphylococcus pseudintermedius]MDT0898504.1 TnsA endonuclease N-terminal domain-containing protein [Staphylococcus pseudintermedius]MDT0932451.1 TnsA endonuclease N-terminal domain-containing protein [Staphylococcus pseudintermedius]MDU9276724.1 TnsA endonuclease N-terminal domain-containing protein [Staphylococcus pseudintermedius]WMZ50088.1 TnsA endonuclease N-terminal domain-containing protein [Staphylococcus pseudintermedius]